MEINEELVTRDNMEEIRESLGEFDYTEEIEVGDVLTVLGCENGYKIIVWENRTDEDNAVIDFGDDYFWGQWDGARITVEEGNEIVTYDTEGNCRLLGVA